MQDQSYTWKDFLYFLMAVIAFGAGYIVDHQAAVIGFAAIGVVWIVAQFGKTFPQLAWVKGKAFLTGLVFAVSFGLSFLFQPLTWPTVPTWTGDIATYTPLLAVFVSALFVNIQSAALFAIGVYNVLLAQVMDKLSGSLTARINVLLNQ